MTHLRLGCLPHSPERAALLPAARYSATLPPPSLPAATWQPQMADNDTLPNCTAVALWNAGRAWSNKLAATDFMVPVTAVDALYAAAIGMPGATAGQLAATDGADPMDMVEIAQARGWDIGGQVPIVPDFATVASSRTALAMGMARTGSVMLAVTLYDADMDAFEAGRPWVAAPSGDITGGHMVCAASYNGLVDSQSVQCASWGTWQSARWDWIAARLRLALVTGWRQLDAPGTDYGAVWG